MQNKILIINYPGSESDFRLPILKYFLERNDCKIDILINPLWDDYPKKPLIKHTIFYILKNIHKEIIYLFKAIYKIYKYKYNIIIIGYPAYIEVFFLSLFLSRNNKKTIYTEFLISIFDTIILDRKYYKNNSVMSFFLHKLDKLLLAKSNKILVDTKSNINRYAKLFNINPDKFFKVFVGSYNFVNNNSYQEKNKSNSNLNIGWVGSIIPLHGIDEIINCAIFLKNTDIKFHIIGNGQKNEIEQIKEIIESQGINNIILYNELKYAETMNIINSCDICLGIFGKSDKAKSVIPFKIFDYLYLNKIIITQKSEAIDEIPQFNSIFKVDNNSKAIAEEILKIKTNINQSYHNRDLLKLTIDKQIQLVFQLNNVKYTEKLIL